MATGKERWRADLMAKFNAPVPAFGFVASPLVMGDHVYVQAGGGFVKLDKQTGEVIWRTLEDDGGMHGSAFSSPLPATLNGVPQILVQTRQKPAGVDAETGKVLWSIPVKADQGMNILTPTVIGMGSCRCRPGIVFVHGMVESALLSQPEEAERERFVIMARFGLDGQPRGQSLRVIASQLGLSKERVRQIVLRALEQLRGTTTSFSEDLLRGHV